MGRAGLGHHRNEVMGRGTTAERRARRPTAAMRAGGAGRVKGELALFPPIDSLPNGGDVAPRGGRDAPPVGQSL